MKKIFIGFLLIFLDFSLNLGNSRIGLIPDFIGYIVMINGLLEMAEESPLFIKVKPFATFMAVYTGIVYFIDLVGISASPGFLSIVLGIVSAVISLYISYNIIMGVKDMEEIYNTPLNGSSLKSTWTILAVFNILNFVFLLIPALAIISVIVSFIVAICFLVAFNNSKNLYYNMKSWL
ncbi:hypothetical protein SAMN02745823_03082 [Sporobacter termitidis DSM 10068]|uniref:Uncharacterized protein n=1 Tax=Sporobacter termitidis DSM 10068 TaxID=1123282 RepID=A0A1M5Z165_9FIRM|nr:hypothetical protein [Sporobacter termitidis]SHI18015.1 hypothetical protein SAMN02745823_03082 [Sporobacter termitidis DSM 10068]